MRHHKIKCVSSALLFSSTCELNVAIERVHVKYGAENLHSTVISLIKRESAVSDLYPVVQASYVLYNSHSMAINLNLGTFTAPAN